MNKNKSKVKNILYLKFIDQTISGEITTELSNKIYEIYGKKKGQKIINYWKQLPIYSFDNNYYKLT